jgi:hypothetical protein
MDAPPQRFGPQKGLSSRSIPPLVYSPPHQGEGLNFNQAPRREAPTLPQMEF